MRTALAAFALISLIASLPVSAAPTSTGGGSSGGCGKERVSIKQMVDPDTARVNPVPITATVDSLRALPVPAGYSPRNDSKRYVPELQVYDVKALLIGWKLEADKDYHLVIADPQHPADTMIAESIDPSCPLASKSKYAAAFAGVLAAFAQCKAVPIPRYHKFTPPITVEIQGPAFFDVLHGQTGVAPNGIEIHPITVIRSLACPL